MVVPAYQAILLAMFLLAVPIAPPGGAGHTLFSATLPAQQDVQDLNLRFVRNTLQVIKLANPKQKGGKMDVVVLVGSAGNQADQDDAHQIATNLQNAATDSPQLRLTSEVCKITVDASQCITPSVAAVVVIQASSAEVTSLAVLAHKQGTLTLSRRPWDIGLVGIVILSAEMYLYSPRCEAEVCSGALQKQFSQAVTTDYYTNAQKAFRAVYKGGRTPDWAAAVKFLRISLLDTESPNPYIFIDASDHRLYTPHFDLSKALAMLGDCTVARSEWITAEHGSVVPAEWGSVDELFKKKCPDGGGIPSMTQAGPP
jgi:hypothetical protein